MLAYILYLRTCYYLETNLFNMIYKFIFYVIQTSHLLYSIILSVTSVNANISVSEMDAAMRHDALKYASSNSVILLFAAVTSA